MRVTIALDGPELDIPEHPDGDVWPHIVEHGGPEGDEMTFAETAADALSVLIEGYEDIPDSAIEDAEDARYFHAVRIASVVQAYSVKNAIEKHGFDTKTAGEEVLTALFTDKTATLPHDLFEGTWDEDIPLFLVDLNYAPYTDRELPEGNVKVLRTHNEIDYLTSLHEIGMIRYHIQSTGNQKEI